MWELASRREGKILQRSGLRMFTKEQTTMLRTSKEAISQARGRNPNRMEFRGKGRPVQVFFRNER
jgi:hypothetical protein